jgi:membrane protease YdiL (CAAX protease family)
MEKEKELIKEERHFKWGPWSSLILSIIVYFVSQFVVIIPMIIISVANNGQDIATILDNSSWAELALAGVSSLSIIGILYILLKIRGNSFKDLGFRKPKWSDITWLLLGLLIYIVLLAISLIAASFIPGFDAEQTQDIGYKSAQGWQLLLAFTGLVILPPLAEEMMFRGFMYRGMANRWPKIISALLSSGLFALVHFQWNVGVDVFILSLVMIFLLEKTKNLWVCVALHAVKNCIAFLSLFVFASH